MNTKLSKLGPALAAASLVVTPDMLLGQEGAAQAAPSISVEMNQIQQHEGACQLTFMLRNTLESDIATLVFETVLLTKDGAVNRLTLFDMRDVPSGTPRVRQFNVPALACVDLGQVLINGVAECSGNALDAQTCIQALQFPSRIDVEILG
ncbi:MULTISPECIES: hypothetical protein [Rhodobacterales]|uniref:hypothetical protein n=1 Tax=Rhodobacterales TaxID=204455 RepID=UPI00215D8230|nr:MULTISPECIES: hypothetical protein [Rhodobacterales]MDO6591225.1 hypothetical protein [Yoonia sp. 1_MG-2023]